MKEIKFPISADITEYSLALPEAFFSKNITVPWFMQREGNTEEIIAQILDVSEC